MTSKVTHLIFLAIGVSNISAICQQNLAFTAFTHVQTLPIRFTPTPTRARMGANRI